MPPFSRTACAGRRLWRCRGLAKTLGARIDPCCCRRWWWCPVDAARPSSAPAPEPEGNTPRRRSLSAAPGPAAGGTAPYIYIYARSIDQSQAKLAAREIKQAKLACRYNQYGKRSNSSSFIRFIATVNWRFLLLGSCWFLVVGGELA